VGAKNPLSISPSSPSLLYFTTKLSLSLSFMGTTIRSRIRRNYYYSLLLSLHLAYDMAWMEKYNNVFFVRAKSRNEKGLSQLEN
jgi:hypothetical protein